MYRLLLIGLLAVAGMAGYIWSVAPLAKPKGAQQQAVTVSVAPVVRRDVPVLLTGIGSVQALNTVQIRSRVDGTLDSVNFNEGQLVKKDQVLVSIDPRLYQAALDQAKAKKAQDEAQLVSDLKDLERAEQLSAQKFASQQSVDQLTAKVGVDRALIAADQAAIETAQTNLGYTTISAPFEGRIGLRNVDPGNIVRANDQAFIAVLTQQHPIAVVFTLPEVSLAAVREGMRNGAVKATAYDQDGRKPIAEGRLEVIDNQVDQTSGTIRLKAIFANTDDTLWPGQYTPVRVQVALLRSVLTVPTNAIQRGPNGLYVWVAKPDQRAAMVPIATGPNFEAMTVAEKGVSEGDQIIISNQYRLQPNIKVQVSTTPVASAEGGGRT